MRAKVTADRRSVRYRRFRGRGRSRLFVAYFVTTQVALSYFMLAIARRFRRPEAIERLTQEKHRRNARRIEAAILRLRGLFIKVGQLISIMANFLPDAFREELERLQDQVPPRPYRDIEARLREEFGGRGPTELFAEFSPEPVASASIGQVHRARLHSGEEVAVKVQYPDIEEIVRIDLQALRRIFNVAALVHARLGLRHHLPRDQRDGAGRARLPARGGGDREDRRQLRGPQRAQTSASRA